MSKLKRILVAVRDVRASSVITLGKAATLARASGSAIELFHVMNEPLATAAIRGHRQQESYAERRADIAELSRQRLERLARSTILRGIDTRVQVVWDYPIHEAIIRRAASIDAHLVVAQAQPRFPAARLLLANIDWELIRHCPCPVLLVKTRARYVRPVILVAVDPFHVNAKPAALDALLVRTAAALSKSLRGELHILHAYVPAVPVVPLAGAPPISLWASPRALRLEARRRRLALGRLARRAWIPAARRHLRMGNAVAELEAVVRRTRARIVIMGAVSRSPLRRFLIGNTAEQVLDPIRADVLVVKPRGFRSGIPKRPG